MDWECHTSRWTGNVTLIDGLGMLVEWVSKYIGSNLQAKGNMNYSCCGAVKLPEHVMKKVLEKSFMEY